MINDIEKKTGNKLIVYQCLAEQFFFYHITWQNTNSYCVNLKQQTLSANTITRWWFRWVIGRSDS